VALKEFSDYLRCMHWSIVLLKFGIANGAVDVINDWEEEGLKQPTIDGSID